MLVIVSHLDSASSTVHRSFNSPFHFVPCSCDTSIAVLLLHSPKEVLDGIQLGGVGGKEQILDRFLLKEVNNNKRMVDARIIHHDRRFPVLELGTPLDQIG